MGQDTDPELRKVIEVIESLIYRSSSLCIPFSEIKRETGLHQQVLTKLLRRGKAVGLIAECNELGIGNSGYTTLPNYVVYLEYTYVNEVVEVFDSYIVMRHSFKGRLYNNSLSPIRGVEVKVFGDIFYDKPLVFKGVNHYEVDWGKSTVSNYYAFHFDDDVEIKPRDTYEYEYEFYLKYFPPVDYFIVEPINPAILFNVKTYLTKGGRRVIKGVRVEYPPNVIVREEEGKTYHEIEVLKLPVRPVKFKFYLTDQPYA